MTGLCMETMRVFEYGTRENLHETVVPLKNKQEVILRKRRKFVKDHPVSDDTNGLEPAVQKVSCTWKTIDPMDKWGKVKMCHDACQKCKRRCIRRMTRNAIRLSNKVSNRVKDAHCCIAKSMCQQFRTILIPDFRVKGMTGRGKSSKAVRKDMLAWCHYKFKQILVQAARRTNTTLVQTWEPYTSQSCCLCHRVTRCTGDTFKCRFDDCGANIPRDWNGAGNNCLSFLALPLQT